MIVQAAPGIAGDEAMQIHLVTERQTHHVVTFQIRLPVGAVDDAAAAIGREAIKQAIEYGHGVPSRSDRGIIRDLVAHKMSL